MVPPTVCATPILVMGFVTLGVKGQITVATANIDKNPVWFKSGRKEYQACNLQTPE